MLGCHVFVGSGYHQVGKIGIQVRSKQRVEPRWSVFENVVGCWERISRDSVARQRSGASWEEADLRGGRWYAWGEDVIRPAPSGIVGLL